MTKTSTGTWTAANVAAGNSSPTTDIEGAQRLVLKELGAMMTDIIFTTSAWEGFIADPLLKGAIYYPVLGTSGNNLNPGAEITRGAVYKGRWGMYNLWVYNEWYISDGYDGNSSGTEYPMLPDGYVIMCGPDMMALVPSAWCSTRTSTTHRCRMHRRPGSKKIRRSG